MSQVIRGILLGSVTMALMGMAGCGEDNEKRASEDFKNTQTAPESKPASNQEVRDRYNAAGKGYAGRAPKSSSSPAPAK